VPDYRRAVSPDPTGATIRVRVVPRAAVARLDGLRGDAAMLRVRAPPSGGKANAEVVALLAGLLGVRRRDVVVVRGERSRDKIVRVAGLGPSQAAARLARATA
jgi:uncharacterized protein